MGRGSVQSFLTASSATSDLSYEGADVCPSPGSGSDLGERCAPRQARPKPMQPREAEKDEGEIKLKRGPV